MRAPPTEVGFPAGADPVVKRHRYKAKGSLSSGLMAFCTPLSKLISSDLSFLQEAGLAQRAKGSSESRVCELVPEGVTALSLPGTQD